MKFKDLAAGQNLCLLRKRKQNIEIITLQLHGDHKDCKEKEEAEPTVKLSFSHLITAVQRLCLRCVMCCAYPSAAFRSRTKTNRSGALVCVQKRKLRFPSASGQSVNVAKVNRIFIAHTKLMNDPL
ncbi:hypothetical protein T01_13516 [Trichinella spiralis]|uniref:Uncharacterized protein n=1 Tax=Trichinella spiralis TaxID=6334 RepID=A0A0V1B5M9_TRISP|nr:hypothetical protein T01_13516 [Trichinella spiralis]